MEQPNENVPVKTTDVAAQWYEEETNSEITVPEFEDLCEKVFSQNKFCKEIDAHLELEKEILKKMKVKLMALMTEFGKSKYSSNAGTLFKKSEFSVKTPKDPESRELFFAWLKEQGLFDNLISVNSKTLVSLYNSKLEEVGPEFQMPGITEVTSYESLNIRSK
jgi:hypothetical protein